MELLASVPCESALATDDVADEVDDEITDELSSSRTKADEMQPTADDASSSGGSEMHLTVDIDGTDDGESTAPAPPSPNIHAAIQPPIVPPNMPTVFSNDGARISDVSLAGLTFTADFDSGNIVRMCQRSEVDAAMCWRDSQSANSPPRNVYTMFTRQPSFQTSSSGGGSTSPPKSTRPPPLFTLWARADCEGSVHATKSRSWFSFAVRGAAVGRILQFEVRTSNQEKLFRHDMRPCYRSLPSQPEWRPIKAAAQFVVRPRHPGSRPRHTSRFQFTSVDSDEEEDEEDGAPKRDPFAICFSHRVSAPETPSASPTGETLYFAFCYPHAYCDEMAHLAWLDALFQRPKVLVAPPVAPLLLPLPASWLSTIIDWIPAWLGGRTQNTPETLRELAAAGAAVAAGGAHGQTSWFGGGGWLGAADHKSAMASSRGVSFLDSHRERHSHRTATSGSSSRSTASAEERLSERQQLQRFNQVRLRAAAQKAAMEASRSTKDYRRATQPVAASAAAPDGHTSPEAAAAQALAAVEARSAAEASFERTATELARAAVSGAAARLPSDVPPNVYYRRELLARSIEGRRIDLLTITSTDGAATSGFIFEDALPAPLMPEGGGRPARFPKKKYVIFTARVHPGESPSSHALNGLLDFLLRADDPRAVLLRERFVFKIIPMLNPDGVYHGHTRADTRGTNLNRKYTSATYEAHPSVFASVAVARQLHAAGWLHAIIDIHAHAGKRGCFFYGNRLINPAAQAEAALFMSLCALNSRWLALNGCTFFGSGSHDGSSRAALYRLTGLPLIFTLEANYNRCTTVNELPKKQYGPEIDAGRLSPEPPAAREISPKFDPTTWSDLGKATAIALLDMSGLNPASRLGPLPRREEDLRRMRGSVGTWATRQWANPNQICCPSEEEDADDDPELAAVCEEADVDADDQVRIEKMPRAPSNSLPPSPLRGGAPGRRFRTAGNAALAATAVKARAATARPTPYHSRPPATKH